MMNRILTSVALCFAIAAAQQADSNNATDTSASVAASAPASSSASIDTATTAMGSSGPVAMIPVSESSEPALDTPSSTPVATTEAAVSTHVQQQSAAPSPASSEDSMSLESPATETSEAVLATPSSSESPQYTFAPTTTDNTPTSNSPEYTFAPTTTDNTTPVAPVPVTASSEGSLQSPTHVADTTESPTLRVAQTEQSNSQLDTPTPSPSDTPEATSREYSFAPTTTANEAASSPEYTFAPTTADNTPASEQPKETHQFTYAPTSDESSTPTVAPVPVPAGSSASFAVGTDTIGLGETATVGSQPVIIQTNSMGNTEIQVGATGTPSMIAYPSSEVEISAPANHEVTHATAPPSVTQNSAGDYMIGSLTLAPGSSITQGSGEATQVMGLSTNSAGSTQLIVGNASGTATQAVPSGAAPSTLETQVSSQIAVLNGHSVAIESPAFTAHTEATVFTLNGHTVTASGQPILPSNVIVINGHTVSTNPEPTLKSNEMVLNGKTLTVSPVLPSTSVIDHVVTVNGHTVPVGAATLAAEPTGISGVESAPSSTASLQGSASKTNLQSCLFGALGVVFGAVALLM